MWLPTGLLFIPKVIIYEHGESWWNDSDRRKLKNSEKTCPSVNLSTTILTRIDLGANLGLCSDRLAQSLLFIKKGF
jgi:hypothetical protein